MDDPSVVVPGSNPSCGDEIELELDEKDGMISGIAYNGVGCAISQASVSIMADLVRGKTLEQAKELAYLFLAMCRREDLDEEQLDQLEEAVALQNISNMPARVKCANMPWYTLVKAIDEVAPNE